MILPKEHGSWSLALEPVALGLLVAPSLPGLSLGLAAAAGFLSRRSLRLLWSEPNSPHRRAAAQALAFLSAIAAACLALSAWLGSPQPFAWLAPAAAGGAVFLAFDLRKSGREQWAEVAGAFAFAWLPAAMAALAGRSDLAGYLTVVMLARAVPTVMTVRAYVRGVKTGQWSIWPAVAASVLAAVAGGVLAAQGHASVTAAGFLLGFAARAFVLLVAPRPRLRAKTLGIAEMSVGIAFVVAVALTWPR